MLIGLSLLLFIIGAFLFITGIAGIDKYDDTKFTCVVLGICLIMMSVILNWPTPKTPTQEIKGVVEKVEPFGDQVLFHFEDGSIASFDANGVAIRLTPKETYKITYKEPNKIVDIAPVPSERLNESFIKLD